MESLQNQYDEAMFAFSQGNYPAAIARLESILAVDPDHFDSRLAIGMAYSRLGDQTRAIEEGHRAEALRPSEQLVHTNLSLFYLKAGNKTAAEHHGLQARIASWKGNLEAPAAKPADPDSLPLAPSAPAPPPPVKAPVQFPDMPWKKPRQPPGA